MLLLKNKRAEFEELGASYSKIIPFLLQIQEDKILCKDGSIFVTFLVEGKDYEGVDAEEINSWFQSMDKAYQQISNERIMVWWNIVKRKIKIDTDSEGFKSKYSKVCFDSYINSTNRYNFYKKSIYLTIGYRPTIGSDKFFETYTRLINNGESILAAAQKTIRSFLSMQQRGLADLEDIVEQIVNLDSVCSMFKSNVDAVLKLKRLSGEELRKFAFELINPASDVMDRIPPFPNRFLDDALANNRVEVNANFLEFVGPTRSKFVTTFSPKMNPSDWPSATVAGSIRFLENIDAELNVTLAYKMISPRASKNYAESIKKHHLNMKKGIREILREAITKTEVTEVRNKDRETFANEIDKAINDMTYNPPSCFAHISLDILADSPEEIEKKVELAVSEMGRFGLVAFRESIHSLSTYVTTFPCNWSQSVRWTYLFGGNLSDISPIFTQYPGEKINTHLSRFYGKPVPALNYYIDSTLNLYYYNHHQQDLPHVCVIGPSRSGKSVFNLLNLTAWERYDTTSLFFDKDYTCEINVKMRNGNYLDPKFDFSINPFYYVDNEYDWAWVNRFVQFLLESNGASKLTPLEVKELNNGIEELKLLPKDQRRLLTLSNLVNRSISDRLDRWIGNGSLNFFDNSEDTFELTGLTAIEMSNLLKNNQLAAPFMDYMFWRVDKYLAKSTKPMLIYIEEAWFMLADEGFASILNDWLRTLAKKEGHVVMATQSLNEIQNSSAFASIIDNIPTFIYLPNPKAEAHRDLYRRVLSLTDTEIDIIKTMTPKREYMVYNREYTRVINAIIPKESLAICRSDKSARAIFAKHEKSGDPAWRDRYFEEVLTKL